jgi:CubicO group peptidase (beta-lactamase class C family)
VREAFAENILSGEDTGAACAAYWKGEKVADLWGGIKALGSEEVWKENTVVLMFSATKGMAAVAMAVAHSQGLFEYDETVAEYWPEFAQKGKEHITVRQLLGHQAGLAAIKEGLTPDILGDLDALAEILARQSPEWTPGDRHGYHSNSLGWYEGELLRRVDPEHRTLGRFFADEVAKPCDAEFHIGLPDDFDRARLARVHLSKPASMMSFLRSVPPKFLLSMLNPWSLTMRSMVKNPKLSSFAALDSPTFWPLEIPASAGIGEVRGVARIYGDLATGGKTLGIKSNTMAELLKAPAPPRKGRYDLVLKTETCFSLGFLRPFPVAPFGSNEKAFGCPGVGGSFGFADPDLELGYAWAPNKLGVNLFDDPRELACRNAVYEAIRKNST